MAAVTAVLRRGGDRPHRNMVRSHAEGLRILATPGAKVWAVLLVAAYVALPGYYSDRTLLTLAFAGVYAIGTIGLNLLIGYTGQVSLGHAAFFGVGAYAAAYLGEVREMPFPVYLLASAVLGLVIGAVLGPFALRLRGQYLAVVTIGLLFLAEHLFNNWTSVTGGGNGASVRNASVSVGPLDFKELVVADTAYTFAQGMFWLVWAVVALTALLAKNLVRTRPGRAMQAVRDRDLSAEVIGVRISRYKVGAFAVAGAMAAVSGCFYGLLQGYVNPLEFGGQRGLFLSITFVAMMIIGGVGTVFGSILGALLVYVGQDFIRNNANASYLDPIIIGQAGDGGLLTTGEFNGVVFGLLIVVFLLVEPRGLAALWFRIKAYFKTWPFSY